MKKATNQGSTRVCKEFAATDFKVLSIAYIHDVEKKGCVLDPSEYLFVKGAIERACVKDQRPLFERQRNSEISDLDYRSLITSLKNSRIRAREEGEPDEKMLIFSANRQKNVEV